MALPKSPPRLAKTMYYERAYRRLTFPERPAQSRECECDYESDILFFRLLTPLCRVIFGSIGKVETRKKADTKKLISVRLRPYRRCHFPFRIILHPFRSTDSSGKQGGAVRKELPHTIWQSENSCRTPFGGPSRSHGPIARALCRGYPCFEKGGRSVINKKSADL